MLVDSVKIRLVMLVVVLSVEHSSVMWSPTEFHLVIGTHAAEIVNVVVAQIHFMLVTRPCLHRTGITHDSVVQFNS